MNKSNDIANAVVNEQFNRMLKQERKRFELLPIPDFEWSCSFLGKDQMFEVALHMAVMMKISTMARLN